MGEGECRGMLTFCRRGVKFNFNGLGPGRIWEWCFVYGYLLGDYLGFIEEF